MNEAGRTAVCEIRQVIQCLPCFPTGIARQLCRSSIIVDLPVVSYGVHFTPPGAAGTPSATVADAVDHLLGGDIDIVCSSNLRLEGNLSSP
jgi:hypothetical protein